MTLTTRTHDILCRIRYFYCGLACADNIFFASLIDICPPLVLNPHIGSKALPVSIQVILFVFKHSIIIIFAGIPQDVIRMQSSAI